MHLTVLTPEGPYLDTQTHSVIVPAENGLLGILRDHAPILAGLKSGKLTYSDGAGKKEVKIGSGLVEVNDNKIIVLTGSAEA